MARERGHSELRTAHRRGGGQVRQVGMVGRVKGDGLGYTRPIAYHGSVGFRSPVANVGAGQLASRENDGRARRWVLGPDFDRGSRKDEAGIPHREYVGWQGREHNDHQAGLYVRSPERL